MDTWLNIYKTQVPHDVRIYSALSVLQIYDTYMRISEKREAAGTGLSAQNTDA
jgi:hypothetical protein